MADLPKNVRVGRTTTSLVWTKERHKLIEVKNIRKAMEVMFLIISNVKKDRKQSEGTNPEEANFIDKACTVLGKIWWRHQRQWEQRRGHVSISQRTQSGSSWTVVQLDNCASFDGKRHSSNILKMHLVKRGRLHQSQKARRAFLSLSFSTAIQAGQAKSATFLLHFVPEVGVCSSSSVREKCPHLSSYTAGSVTQHLYNKYTY